MRTAEEILKVITCNGCREIEEERALQAMREYAKEVAREALKNASENATFNVTGILTNNQYKEKSLLYEKGVGNRVVERTVTINKQSILSDKNIPEI